MFLTVSCSMQLLYKASLSVHFWLGVALSKLWFGPCITVLQQIFLDSTIPKDVAIRGQTFTLID